MTEYNLEQTQSSVNTNVESYRDLLYQIYSDDEVIDLVRKLNSGENIIVNKNQLQRKMRGFFYTKEYVRSITVVTRNGTRVFWGRNYRIFRPELLDEFIRPEFPGTV